MNIEMLKTLVGQPYRDFDEYGHYLGCFEPMYLLYPNLPKYPLPKLKEVYCKRGIQLILENFKKVANPEPLDLIVFCFRGEHLHVGIFLEAGKFFHVQRGSAFEIQRLSLYENKILGYFKVKNIEAGSVETLWP